MDAQQLPQIITDVVTNYLAGGAQDDLKVLLNPEQFEAAGGLLETGQKPEGTLLICPKRIGRFWFKLVFENNDVLYDFSDEALAGAIRIRGIKSRTQITTVFVETRQ